MLIEYLGKVYLKILARQNNDAFRVGTAREYNVLDYVYLAWNTFICNDFKTMHLQETK